MTPDELAAMGLRIKPLEWREHPWSVGDSRYWDAQTVFGEYGYGVDRYGVAYYRLLTAGSYIDTSTADAARAAAEADYAAQIAAMIERTE